MRIGKRHLAYLLSTVMLVSGFADMSTCVSKAEDNLTGCYSSEDGIVASDAQNSEMVVTWKEGSNATASWEKIEGANYYEIETYVYSLDGVSFDSRITGTTETEIDVQQEIYNIWLENNMTDNDVLTSFMVRAIYKSVEGTDVELASSSMSTQIVYNIKDTYKFETPQNLELSEDFIASWDCVELVDEMYEHTQYNITLNINGKIVSYGHGGKGREGSYIENGRIYVDLSDLKEVIYFLDTDDIDISFKVKVFSFSTVLDNVLYLDSDDSEWSNTCRYHDDKKKVASIDAPENVQLSDDYIVSWSDVEDATSYTITVSINDEETEYWLGLDVDKNTVACENGIYSLDISEEIEKQYAAQGYTMEPVAVKVFVYAVYEHTMFNMGGFFHGFSSRSDASNEVEYVADLEVYEFEEVKNITITDDMILKWDPVSCYDELISRSNSDLYFSYYIYAKLETGWSWSYAMPIQYGTELNIADDIRMIYNYNGLTNELVKLSVYISLRAQPECYDGVVYQKTTSTPGTIMYRPRKAVEAITLSPSNPILYKGNSMFLGKTIIPEDAYYHTIDWTSDNDLVVSVDDNGRITGKSVGSTAVTATIGEEISDSVTVNVYDISSNIQDESEAGEVTDIAGDIIDDIANNDDPDVDNTDIPKDKVEDIKEEIHDAIENGDTFHTDIKAIQNYFNAYKENWGQIQKAARDLNAQFMGAYNIEVEMYHKDTNGTDYHIGNITELDNEITFTFDLPTGMKELETGDTKKFVLVRVHKNTDGKIEYVPIDFTINDDGTFTAKSNQYSDFVWLSVGEKACDDGNHLFTFEDPSEDAQKSAATCTEKAKYYKSCAFCGVVSSSNEDIFEYGAALGHDITQVPFTSIDETKHGRRCSLCHEVIETENHKYTVKLNASTYQCEKCTSTKSVPGIVILKSATSATDSIKVVWEQTLTAKSYIVYRHAEGESWKKIGTSTTTSYIDSTADFGVNYAYTVKAVNDIGASVNYDKTGVIAKITTKPGAVTLLEPIIGNTAIRVNWQSTEYATSYIIYRHAAGESWKKIGTSTTTSYVDTTAIGGTNYAYTVKAVNVNGASASYDKIGVIAKITARPGKVTLLEPTIGKTAIRVNWKATPTASSYIIYRHAKGEAWTKIGTSTTTTYVDETVIGGKNYAYTVKAVNKNGVSISYDKVGIIAKITTKPGEVILLDPTIGKTAIRVNWKETPTASSYEIYRHAKGESWTKIGTSTTTSYVDATAVGGKNYAYTVKAVNGNGSSTSYNTTGVIAKITALPGITTMVGATAYTGYINVQWKTTPTASSYNVYRKTADGKWTKIGTTTKTVYNDKTAVKGTTYYYTVIATNGNGACKTYDKTGVSATAK